MAKKAESVHEQPGLRCPHCFSTDLKTVRTMRTQDNSVKRYKRCKRCQGKITTLEVAVGRVKRQS